MNYGYNNKRHENSLIVANTIIIIVKNDDLVYREASYDD